MSECEVKQEDWSAFPFVWLNRNSALFHKQTAYCIKEHGTGVVTQMAQWNSHSFGKTEKIGLPLKVFFFSENFSVVTRTVQFDFPPKQWALPYNGKRSRTSSPWICVVLAAWKARFVNMCKCGWVFLPYCLANVDLIKDHSIIRSSTFTVTLVWKHNK